MRDDDLGRLLDHWLSIDDDARRQGARQIIDSFDGSFDIPGRRCDALGALTILLREAKAPALLQDRTDPAARGQGAFEALALYVGEAWCRLVDADMTYDLLTGLETRVETQSAAERLRAIIDAAEQIRDAPAGQAPWGPFARYVLARWYDGAGRINFRSGDMIGAAEDFERASKLAEDMPWCRGDIASNSARAHFDAEVQVGRKPQSEELRDRLARELERATLETAGIVGRSLDALASDGAGACGWWDPEPAVRDFPRSPPRPGLGARAREAIRGLCNLEHNLSVVYKEMAKTRGKALEADSLRHSERSARYAWANADEYRFAQALRHMADIAPRDGDSCRALSMRVKGLCWRRGQWMATQYLGEHYKTTDNAEARRLLVEALNAIEESQRRRGGDLGLDVDVWQYTVAAYRRVVTLAPGPDDLLAVEERERRAASSLRRAVKAPLYRRRFKENVLPLYNEAITRRAGELCQPAALQEKIEALLALVEQTAARELLDLLSPGDAAGDPSVRPSAVAESDADPFPMPDTARTDGGKRRDAPRGPGETSEALRATLDADRKALERQDLQRRTTGAEVDEDVAMALRRLSARPDGPTILRYFTYSTVEEVKGEKGPEKKTVHHLAAVVVRGGVISHVIPLEAANLEALAKDNTFRGTPDVAFARRLWEVLVEPLWKETGPWGTPAPDASGAPNAPKAPQLVVIPAPGMFSLPLHVALVNLNRMEEKAVGAEAKEAWRRVARGFRGASEVPLCTLYPVAFTVSVTSYLTRGRYLLQSQPFDPTDDLCALVPDYGERNIDPAELVGTGWPARRFHLAGRAPAGFPRPPNAVAGTEKGLAAILQHRAEVFVFAGHGDTVPVDKDAEVVLQLDAGQGAGAPPVLSQYRLLLGDLRLRHNKWTLLNACVSGGGADDVARAEVVGFIKAFIAAGAGALTVTLWPVHDRDIARVSRGLLQAAARAAKTNDSVDIVREVHALQRHAYDEAVGATAGSPDAARDGADPRGGRPAWEGAGPVPFHTCPVVVYL